MARSLTLSWLLCFVLVVADPAAGQESNSYDNDFAEFVTYYYQDPDPDGVLPTMEDIVALGVLENQNVAPPVIGFLAEVFAQNPRRMPEWQQFIDAQPDAARSPLMISVALSRNPEQLIAEEPATPHRNDMCWGAFFASGDRAYLDLLMTQAANWEGRDDLVSFTTAASAKWSLASNAESHPLVKEAVENALETATEPLAGQLREVLATPPHVIMDETTGVIREQVRRGKW